MFKFDCPKCAGKGEIRAYIGIAGGICFACNGKGHIIQKTAPKKSPKWIVSAIHRETRERMQTNTITAPNEAKALQKAINQLAGGKGYIPNTAQVERML